jgi:hypothetical protein
MTIPYLVQICATGGRTSEETMVVKDVTFEFKQARDPEETIEDGAGPDWSHRNVSEDFLG